MKRVAFAILVAVACAPAVGSPPENTAGPLDCSTGICTSKLVRETIPETSKSFRWTTLTQQFNKASEGENVATYSQMWKGGFSPSWGLVSESRCVFRRGGCHGAEIDLVVDGPLQPGDWRLGQSIVIWKMPGSSGTPTANYALLIAPQWNERDTVRVDVGVGIQTRCNVACLQIRSGERIALDDDGKVAIRYDPVSRDVQILSGDRVVWHVSTQ